MRIAAAVTSACRIFALRVSKEGYKLTVKAYAAIGKKALRVTRNSRRTKCHVTHHVYTLNACVCDHSFAANHFL